MMFVYDFFNFLFSLFVKFKLMDYNHFLWIVNIFYLYFIEFVKEYILYNIGTKKFFNLFAD